MTNYKWTQGVPPSDGWFWIYDGQGRRVCFTQRGKIYSFENQHLTEGFPLDKFPNGVDLWWMPCDVPPKPEG